MQQKQERKQEQELLPLSERLIDNKHKRRLRMFMFVLAVFVLVVGVVGTLLAFYFTQNLLSSGLFSGISLLVFQQIIRPLIRYSSPPSEALLDYQRGMAEIRYGALRSVVEKKRTNAKESDHHKKGKVLQFPHDEVEELDEDD